MGWAVVNTWCATGCSTKGKTIANVCFGDGLFG
jgi:hypothetical protein